MTTLACIRKHDALRYARLAQSHGSMTAASYWFTYAERIAR